MALTESAMLDLHTPLPNFQGVSVNTGKVFCQSDLEMNKPVLIAFICNHCPYVQYLLDAFVELARKNKDRIQFIAISVNDIKRHPEDAPEGMRKLSQQKDFSFPYIYDESQDSARNFSAVCTPDFFLFNNKHALVYRGELSSAGFDEAIKPTADIMMKAILTMEQNDILESQKPSIGCSIKWT